MQGPRPIISTPLCVIICRPGEPCGRHRFEAHGERRHADWTPDRIKREAAGTRANCAILVEVILRDRVRREKAPPEPFSAPSHPGTGVPSLHGHHAPCQTAWRRTARSCLRPGLGNQCAVLCLGQIDPPKWSHWNAIGPRELPAKAPSVRAPLATATLERSRRDGVKDGSADGPAISHANIRGAGYFH